MPSENQDMPPEDQSRTAVPVARPLPDTDRRAAWYVRATLLSIGVTLAVVFGIAVYLDPYNPDGTARTMATHTKLGIPPCNFVTWTGKPCPSCGMTTSFALLVRGDVISSLRANWVGTLLATFWAGLLVWSVAGWLVGRPLLVPRGRGELVITVIVGAFLVLMLGRWLGVLLTS